MTLKTPFRYRSEISRSISVVIVTVEFIEKSILSVFEPCWLIIQGPDEVCQFFCGFLSCTWSLIFSEDFTHLTGTKSSLLFAYFFISVVFASCLFYYTALNITTAHTSDPLLQMPLNLNISLLRTNFKVP